MARQISQIQLSIKNSLSLIPEFATLVSNNSKRSIWGLFTYVQSVAIATLEQIIDQFKTEVEAIVAAGIPGTPNWLVDKIFKFQFSLSNPQVIQLIDLVPTYPIVDDTLRIVTRCGVKTTLSNRVFVKTAKQEPPIALDPAELAALQNYINTIGVAGVDYIVTSLESDKIYIDADIFYLGQYSSVIQDSVISNINTLLADLEFVGDFKISDLELKIRQIPGVSDVLLKNVTVRQDTQLVSEGIKLVQNQTVISRIYPTIAGYITDETTSGFTLVESLNFIAI